MTAHLLTQGLGNLPNALITFPFLRQTDRHLDRVVHRGGEHSGDSRLVVRTGRGVDHLDARYEFQETRLQFAGSLEGLLNTRTAL